MGTCGGIENLSLFKSGHPHPENAQMPHRIRCGICFLWFLSLLIDSIQHLGFMKLAQVLLQVIRRTAGGPGSGV